MGRICHSSRRHQCYPNSLARFARWYWISLWKWHVGVSLVPNVVASGSATMQHLVLHAHAAMNTSSTALPSDPHHRWSSHCFQVSYSTAEENVKSWYRQVCIKKHLESNCENFYQPVMNSPSKITLRDVLSKPVTIPATPTERRVTEHLVRRLLDESPEEQTIKVSTHGQVSGLYNTF